MSHDHCHDGSCSSHDHHHHHEGGCCCNHHHQDSCCHHKESGDFANDLLNLADEAWMEVLKEKIKEQIKTSNGPQLDGLAKIISDSNSCRWKNKLGLQNSVDEFRHKVEEFFKK